MKPLKAMFFPNGNTAFFREGKQVPDLQQSWLQLYVALLEANGINPLEVEFTLPDGRKAELFATPTGYNWNVRQ